MSPRKQRKKRGWYKKYLNPGNALSIPRSTVSSARRRLAEAVSSCNTSSTGSSDPTDQRADAGNSGVQSLNEQAGSPFISTEVDSDQFVTSTDDSDADGSDLHTDHCGTSCSGSVMDPLHDQMDLFMDPQEPEMQPTQEGSVYMCAENIGEQDSTRETGAEEAMPFCELFKGTIKEKVVVCKGDMLLMLLKFALKNNLTFSALTSMIEMVNLFFERAVLPQSKYALGKVFSETGISMNFYFCCDKCLTVTRQAEQGSTVLCPTCNQALTSSSVTDTSFFVLLDPAPQLQKVLKGCSILDLSKPLESVDVISDIWDGEMYREFVASTMDAGHRISLTLNADGTPLFKSSGTGIWPIQL